MTNEQVASELRPLPKSSHQSLAPLEYLVNQRRGSITDPALFSAQQHDQTSPRHSTNSFNSRNGSYSFPAPNGTKPSMSSSNVDQAPPPPPDHGWAAQASQPIPPDQVIDSPDPNSGRHSAGPDQPRSGMFSALSTRLSLIRLRSL